MEPESLPPVDFFAENLGAIFEIDIGADEPYQVEIIEATAVAGESTVREPFSVLFRGDDSVILPQRIYRLENEGLGPLELFLVPLGPDRKTAGGMVYEAAFS